MFVKKMKTKLDCLCPNVSCVSQCSLKWKSYKQLIVETQWIYFIPIVSNDCIDITRNKSIKT